MVPTKGLMSFTSDEDALKIANGDGGASSSIKVPPGARRPPLKERERQKENGEVVRREQGRRC